MKNMDNIFKKIGLENSDGVILTRKIIRFIKNRMISKLSKKIEKLVWSAYNKVYKKVLERLLPREIMLNEVIERLDIKRGDIYLDAGCGTGDLMLKIYKKGGKVIGLDNSKKWISQSAKKYPFLKFYLHDIDKKINIFSDGMFDGIVSVNTLYLLKNYVDNNGIKVPLILKEFKRLLKIGGRMIIVTPKYPGYSQFKIFKDHLRISIKKSGFFNTLIPIIIYLPHILIVVLVNFYIQFSGKKGYYKFFKEDEIRSYLQHLGFRNIVITDTYSKQNILAICKK